MANPNVKTSVNVTDNSDEVLRAMAEQIASGLEAIGGQAEAYAKEECPVDTGRLRNSITYATSKSHSSGTSPSESEDYALLATPSDKTVYIGTNVEYAPSVEYRDIKHKVGKAHFLRDAATTHGDDYRKIMETALKT